MKLYIAFNSGKASFTSKTTKNRRNTMIPKITHAELPSFIDLAVRTRENLLIVGKPGIGKTVGVNMFADDNNFHVELSHPAIEDPTERSGYPAKATRIVGDELDVMLGNAPVQQEYATHLPFGQQLRLMEATEPTLWFLDDFGQAPASVQAGYMQFLGSRQLGERKIPDCIHIIAATNSREDKAGVKGLLEPVKSRFGIIVELVADLDSFRDYWYKKQLPHVVIDYLNYDTQALHDWNPNIGMENSPCPRLWEKLGKFLVAMKGADDIFVRKVCESTIGEGYGKKFNAFCKMYLRLPRYEEIIADPEGFEINHTADVRYAIMGMMANRAKVKDLPKVFQVVKKFAKEYQIIFMRTISAMNNDLIKSREARTWCAENADIYLSALKNKTSSF